MTTDSSRVKQTSTELSRDRNRAADDRTLLAWIRTSLTLMGFGFGIGKFQDFVEVSHPGQFHDPINGTRIFGGAFIVLGVMAVLLAIFQHWRRLSLINQEAYVYRASLPLTEAVAVLLLLIGLFGLVYIFL